MTTRALLSNGACALLLASTSACTVNRTRVKNDGDGWQTLTTVSCDWTDHGSYLRRGDAPNSPILPVFRSQSRRFNPFALPFDLAFSPITYLVGRECVPTSTERRYVGTRESRRREREALEARKREERAAQKERSAQEDSARLQREAEEKRRRDEAAQFESRYPPLEQSPRRREVRADDFALVVGIERYRSIPQADYGEEDAAWMKRYLEAVGVPAANIILLTGQGASRADLAKYLQEWLPGVVKPGSRVYFYYSGHGAPDPATGEAYLVPWDGDPAFPKSTAYPVSQVYAQLAALPAKESVVFLDACFSGAGGRSVLAKGARPLVMVSEASLPVAGKVAALSAAGPQEVAGGFASRRHGLFSYFLMRGLGGDAEQDGGLTLGQLGAFVAAGVRESARRENRDQNPRIAGDASLRLY
ncbi:MAG: caspase family protein [Elusimicrobiota bacterium]